MVKKGNDIIPERIQSQMREDLRQRLRDFLLTNVMIALPKEKFSQSENFLDEGRHIDDIVAMATRHIDLPAVAEDTLAEFGSVDLGDSAHGGANYEC